jgi:hypothetical protein
LKHTTLILHAVLYLCDLGLLYCECFAVGVLRRIFGPMIKEVTGGWSILHYKELHDL